MHNVFFTPKKKERKKIKKTNKLLPLIFRIDLLLYSSPLNRNTFYFYRRRPFCMKVFS